ncbi:MAG: cytochrome c biogenesis protein CcsA, partial [Nitrospinota bacterium]
LIPIFRGVWLKVHILTASVAYSAFTVTFGVSCLYLLRRGSKATSAPPQGPSGTTMLDTVAYQAAAVGFGFMTLCIITGAIWAEYVWGRYWSWDPKETWSLITWLIFAAYLHTRYHRGWRERKAALLAIAGFITVMVTYVGVDLLMSRQHNFLLWRVP